MAIAAVCLGLTGCAADGGAVDENESEPNEGENAAALAAPAAAAVAKTLYYEGSCAWLKCANGNDARGACGMGCSDSASRFARDVASRASCGATVKVTRGNKSSNAKVWDQSCCGRMEGTKGLLDALGIGHSDGTCRRRGDFTYGSGQGTATFHF
ncbi:hypothetical protein LVJ94_41140 [Pendulispora rubella]|uniref:Lipoprotein n=1 Tax=Pendulispora rubella TaxID=2741070 RepID=A0ABZ2L222_9BACT